MVPPGLRSPERTEWSQVETALQHRLFQPWFLNLVLRSPACVRAQSCLALCNPIDYIARWAPLSMGFSGQEYRSRLPSPPPGDLPDLRIELPSLASPALTGRFFTTSATWEAPRIPGKG